MEKKIELNLTNNNDNIIINNKHTSFKEPYIVFDGVTDSSQGSVVLNRGSNYIGYNFNEHINLSKYIIYPWFFRDGVEYVNCPTGWVLQGSDDNINWIDIQIISNLPTDWKGSKEFKLDKISKHKMFRLYNVVANGYPGFFEIEFYVSDIKKILIKQNNNYISIKPGFHKQLGEPSTDTERNEWFEKYGADDLSVLTTVQDKNTEFGIDKGSIGNSKYFEIPFNKNFLGVSEVK